MLSKHKPVVDVGSAPPMRGAAVTEKRVMHTPAVVQAPVRGHVTGEHKVQTHLVGAIPAGVCNPKTLLVNPCQLLQYTSDVLLQPLFVVILASIHSQ
eukprot:1345224-Rhodomonas_salina.1